jgi:phosphomevalonate kinase
MIACAPGKVVVSGAYAVLEGAPAVVAAVDRYARADSAHTADAPTPEVRAALGERAAPAFDASALRQEGHKLGLGSSAAILVSSLAALELAAHGPLSDEALVERVLAPALAAHRAAQGGGSGIDVAASAHGGVLVARRGESLEVQRIQWPASLCVEVWASDRPASTPALLARVRDLAERNPSVHRARLDALADCAASAAAAIAAADAARFVALLAEQCAALARLGEAAGAPIVTDEVRALARAAEREDSVVLPSGAGGGDVALYVGQHPPSDALRAHAAAHGHADLRLGIGARGVHHFVLSVERS